MQSSLRLVGVAAALVSASAAQSAVSFDANLEHDVLFKGKQGTTKAVTSNSGRVELNAKAELAKSGDNFVNAKASLIVPTGSGDSVGIDDAWIQFGNSTADLKIGRHEAADLFPLGKDVVVDAAASYGYKANTLRGRVKTGQLHAVAGLNAAPGLRIELGLVTEKADALTNAHGVRPTVVYTSGPLTLRAGVESYKVSNVSYSGTGLSLGYALWDGASLNVSTAKNSDTKASSTGLNAVFGAAGVGMVQDKDGSGLKATTYYAAYSFPLLGVKGASITPAVSTSKATGVDNLTSFKVRLNYAF